MPDKCSVKTLNHSVHSLHSHHDSSQEANTFPAVGVRDHVSIPDGQEGDGDEPHGTQERIGAGHILLSVMVPDDT